MTAVAIAAAAALTGCHRSGSGSQQIVGPGTPLSQTRTLAAFEALDAAGTDAVPALRRITLSGDGTLIARDVHATQFDVQLSQLSARAATALLTGTGHITVHVTSSLTATVLGTGTISYSGSPSSVVRSVTGTGSIVAQ